MLDTRLLCNENDIAYEEWIRASLSLSLSLSPYIRLFHNNRISWLRVTTTFFVQSHCAGCTMVRTENYAGCLVDSFPVLKTMHGEKTYAVSMTQDAPTVQPRSLHSAMHRTLFAFLTWLFVFSNGHLICFLDPFRTSGITRLKVTFSKTTRIL